MISALILTLNEEINLPGCLDSLSWCDDIVVFDSGSTDATHAIAKAAGARVFTRTFDHYSAHRNWALDNISFNHPWVFTIDADERMPEDLRAEIHNVVAASTHESPAAYRLRYKNMFMGRWIKHATLYPSWLVRLFRPDKVRYEDRKVNAHPIVEGEIGVLQAHFEHYSFNRGIHHWVDKHNRYASFEAEAALKELSHGSIQLKNLFHADPLIKRRARKNLFFRLPFRPLIKFIYMYVLRLGIIDGIPGLVYCVLQSFYEHMIVVKTWELRRFGPTPGQPPDSARILLINQYYPPDTAATGQLLDDLATKLIADGHSVDVICSQGRYDGGSNSDLSHNPHLTIHRLPATRFARSSTFGKLIDYTTFQLLATRKAKQLPRVDVCLSMTTPPYIGRIGQLLKQRNQTRHILWVMDLYPAIMVAVDQIKENGWLHNKLKTQTQQLLDAADEVISCGEAMTAHLKTLTQTNITTVHNWSPAEPISTQVPVADTPLTLMYSGNPGRAHDLSTLLEELSSDTHSHPIQLRIACSKHAADDIRNSTPAHQLSGVQFTPLVSREELATHLANAHIHLVTQRPETEGLVVPSKIYGILAVGRPVLFIGPPECEVATLIRTANCGLIVEPGNRDELNDALSRLATDTAMRQQFGENARQYYLQSLGRERSLATITQSLTKANVAPDTA